MYSGVYWDFSCNKTKNEFCYRQTKRKEIDEVISKMRCICMKEKIKRTEEALYNYKRMDIIIKNIQIDIENLLNDITLKAVSYDQISSKTNSFNSSVENEVIKREEYIKEQVDILKAKLKYNNDLKVKIEGALGELNSTEYKLISLRYFSREKKTWIAIGCELGFDKDYCVKIRNKIINKMSELIYP